MSEPKYLSVEDLSEELHMSVGTVRNRLSNGDPMPPSIKVGRRRLFPIKQFHSWMAEKLTNNEGWSNEAIQDGFERYRK